MLSQSQSEGKLMPIRNRRKSFISFLLLMIVGTVLSGRISAQTPAQSAPASACAQKLDRLLATSSYVYKAHRSDVWSIAFDKESLKDFKVVVSTDNNDMVVIFVIVAPKARLNLTPEFMQTLLHANHDFDFVKIGTDNDGDLFVRADSTCRLLDLAALKASIEQVASSANELHGRVKGWISADK
jgi:hypothetical protein